MWSKCAPWWLSQCCFLYGVPEPAPGVVLLREARLWNLHFQCVLCVTVVMQMFVQRPTGPGPHRCRRHSSNKSLKVKHDRHTAITPLLWSSQQFPLFCKLVQFCKPRYSQWAETYTGGGRGVGESGRKRILGRAGCLSTRWGTWICPPWGPSEVLRASQGASISSGWVSASFLSATTSGAQPAKPQSNTAQTTS